MTNKINKALIVGANGAIGGMITQILAAERDIEVHAVARVDSIFKHKNVQAHTLESLGEDNIQNLAQDKLLVHKFDLIFIATGMLHDASIQPEKTIKALDPKNMQRLYEVNTIIPAMCVKHFAPLLNQENVSMLATLSARVGSISDNGLGGWYSYRMSKAALNMFIKCASIELPRKYKNSIFFGLHPGTVASTLSQPFADKASKRKIFTPQESANNLLEVIDKVTLSDNGKCFAWDGTEILP